MSNTMNRYIAPIRALLFFHTSVICKHRVFLTKLKKNKLVHITQDATNMRNSCHPIILRDSPKWTMTPYITIIILIETDGNTKCCRN